MGILVHTAEVIVIILSILLILLKTENQLYNCRYRNLIWRVIARIINPRWLCGVILDWKSKEQKCEGHFSLVCSLIESTIFSQSDSFR